MICSNCKKECHAQYYNKETGKWDCEKCTPYLKDDKKQVEKYPYKIRSVSDVK